MLKISIPRPCHEDWNKMNPNEQGRHCNSCAKTVVDFTGMSDDEVKYFFLNKKEERVCGRFKQTQLHEIVIELPQNIFNIEMPLWKKFLVACLVAFSATLFSCDTRIKGDLVQTEQVSQHPKDQYKQPGDTAKVYLGGISFKIDSASLPIETTASIVGNVAPKILVDTIREELMGDIAFFPVPADSIKPKKCEPLLMGKPSVETFITGDTILMNPVSKKIPEDSLIRSSKTKNPPKADSSDCNKMIYY